MFTTGHDTDTSTTMAPYTVSDYLLDRLAEVNVDKVFGVPGDFTLGFLDHLSARDDIAWVGTANELGAGYAADGYARMRGFGVVSTTFGVGELSAINAIAGAFAEHVPVLHLVGSPTEFVQTSARATHHSLGDGDFEHTLRMAAEVTAAQSMLTSSNAASEIDRVLVKMIETSLPGYLSLPADVAEAACTPPSARLGVRPATTDPASLRRFTAAARRLLADRTPTVLADIFVHRAGAQEPLDRFLKDCGLRYASLLWGRRVVDESGPGYLGIYLGAASVPEVREAIEGAPALITVGVSFTDLITGYFAQHLDANRRIDVQLHAVLVAGEVFRQIEMCDAIEALNELVAATSTTSGPAASDAPGIRAHSDVGSGSETDADERTALTQEALWKSVASALTGSDVVFADQGTSFYGMAAERLPHGSIFIGQPLWASIGYTLPALLGAAMAAPERRPVLLIGDGAAQMTSAELGTLIRFGIPAVIVVVNNNGYTVERAIRGANAGYNDIAQWQWTQLPYVLGGTTGTVVTEFATTRGELDDALATAAALPHRLTLIEAVTTELDVPTTLSSVARAAREANS